MRGDKRFGPVAALLCSALVGCTIQSSQPNLKGQDVRLTIIHTADIHSRLFPYNFVPNKSDQDFGLLPGKGPYGGIARIATLVKRIRLSADRSLWLDSGDAWEGAPVFNLFKGEPEIRALSLAGLEGQVLGNHEFDLGSLQLFTMIDQWSQFPHVVANYAWDDSPNPQQRSLKDVVQPFQIYDVQGLRIGVIGMGNQDTLLSSFEGGNGLGFRPLDDVSTLKQYVNLLRPVCDLVVVVSHLGLDNDEGLSASMVDDPNAALAIKGVDLILGGHLHIVTNPPKLLANNDDSMICQTQDCSTVLVHSGAFAKYVGRLDLVVHVSDTGDNGDPEHRSRIVSFAYDNQPVFEGIPDDPDVANLLWPYSVTLHQQINLDTVFAWVGPPATYNKGKIVRNDGTGGDSQLGNLVSRSMMAQIGVEAQFAFTNSLGIRADFEPGPLTNEQMYNVFPFENTIVVMYLSGQEIKDTLDFVAAKSATRGCQSQMQAAGITFDMVCRDNPAGPEPCNTIDPNFGDTPCDPNDPAACTIANPATSVTALNDRCGAPDPTQPNTFRCLQTACAQHIYLGDHCRPKDAAGNVQYDQPVDPVTTPCAPLSTNGLYRVAVNNYIAAGGSGFVVLKRNTSQQDTGVSLRDALTVYLSNQLKVQPDGSKVGVCDGIPTTAITDTTDTKHFPQNSVFQNYGNISCLDETLEPHDGRIRPVFQQ